MEKRFLYTFLFMVLFFYLQPANRATAQIKTVKIKPNSATNAQKKHILKHQINLPAIEGYYKSELIDGETDSCDLSVRIKKIKGQYYYTFYRGSHVEKGKIKLTKGDDLNEMYITFRGIEWKEYEGDVTDAKNKDRRVKLKRPIGIEGTWTDEGIMIQNYGKAMNYYVQIEWCNAQKFIKLVKQ
jgi:hypothetical protein